MRVVRRLMPVLAGLALVATGLAGCDWPEGTRYVHVVFDQLDAETDVAYRTAPNSQGQMVDLRMDIYRPAGDTVTDRPVVMWMFGGGWQGGSKEMMTAYAQDSARRGYVGVTIDYRIRPEGGNILDLAGDAYDDALAAVQWLKDHAAAYGINPDAIVAGGYSAGAVNAMNLLYWPGERGPVDQSTVAGGVAIAGMSLGAPDGDDPPGLMHHGDADTVVQTAWGRTSCDNALAVDAHCTFVTYPGGDHFIAFTQAQQIMDVTADWAFEQVLWPMGYRDEQV